MAIFYVTHYYRRTPSVQGWISTTFVTQCDDDPDFYLGLTGKKYPRENIEIDEANGSLRKVLRNPINTDETVYITPDQAVYIGKILKPRQNKPRLIAKDQVVLPPDIIDVTLAIDDIIRSGKAYEHRHILESYITYDHWKAVLLTIIEAAKKGILHYDQIASMGYLFYKAQNIFGIKAVQFIDSKEASVTDGAIEYFDKRGKKQSVSIILDNSLPKVMYKDGPDEEEFELEESEFIKRR